MSDARILIDAGGRIAGWCTEAERLTGYAAAEAVGSPLEMLSSVPGPDRDRIARIVGDAARQGVTEGVVWQRRKDGSRSRLRLACSGIRDGQGNPSGCVGVLHPVGEGPPYRLLERKALEIVNALVVVLDRDGRIQRFNPACEELTGYPEKEVIGRFVWDFLLAPEDVGPVRSVFSRLLEEPRSRHENVWVTRSGERRWIAWSNAALRGDDGRIEAVLGTGVDVTESRRAEERLRKSEQELRLLIDAVPVLIARLDREGRYVRVNRGYLEWFGLSPEEIEGKHAREVLGEEAYAGIRPYFEAALSGRAECFEREIPYRHGGTRWVSASYTPERDAQGNVTGFISLVADITASKRAELALRESESREHARAAELERFSYTVAHDLRAPLRALHGLSDLLLSEYADRLDEQGREYLQRIADSAKRMDALTLGLLSYSQLGRTSPTSEPIDVGELLRSVLWQMDGELRTRGAQVEVTDTLPLLVGDRMLLSQVLANLLSNAVKFVPAGVPPRVRIRGTREKGRGRVWIDDNGIGVDPKYAERIFGVFERLHRQEDYPGTGIGLAIVRRAMERMGGRVGVEPRHPSGTSFWIELPTGT